MSITPQRPRWKSAMTDRERFNNQMHYKPIDRCFNMEFGYWDENFSVWPMFVENGIRNNAQADEFFNFDRIATWSGRAWMSPGFKQEVISETETHQIIRNGQGLLAEVPKDGHSTIPHYIKSSIETPDDWQKIKAERFRLDDPDREVDVEALKQRHPSGRDYPLGVFCGSMIGTIRDMLTFEGLCYACHDYPEMVEDMVETACVLTEKVLDQVLGKVDFDYASGWEDICFKNGPIVSVPFFRDVVAPRYRRIGDRLRDNGIDIWYTDCDGDVRPVLPFMMQGGINCLFPFEVNGCAHPGELLDEYGKDLRIMGGVNKIALGKDQATIRDYMDTLVPLVERGGYIPFCDHRCPPNVTQENYLFYLDLKEQMFGMK